MPRREFDSIVVDRNVEMVMRDGCILRADVWRPNTAGQYPAALQRTPYSKDDSSVSVVFAGLEPATAAAQGWIVVVQDVRGRYRSEGEFQPFLYEGLDGYDTVEWIAGQSWSDGDVFMYGQSYFGATQLHAAARRPPALRAIVPNLTSSLVRDNWTHDGGAFQIGFCVTWAAQSLSPNFVQREHDSEGTLALEHLAGTLEDQLTQNATALSKEVSTVAPWIVKWRDGA